jgi:hypothetical protein
MTVLDHSPRPALLARPHRRHEIVTSDGMAGVLRIGAALTTCGFAVRDFAADVRDGVCYSSVTCTVALTSAESGPFEQRLAAVPGVVSVDPR